MKRVTIKDIARIAGVSCATVSRALNNSPEVSPETQKRIREICQQQGYHANLLARSLVSSRTNTIGLIVPNVSHPFYGEVALDVELCAQEKGYGVMMCNSFHHLDETKELLQHLISSQVDGIILADSHDDIYRYVITHTPGIPIVLLGDFPVTTNPALCDMVIPDNYTAGVIATEHLINLGHREIAYIDCHLNSTAHTRRRCGYLHAMEMHHLSPTALQSAPSGSTLESGVALTRQLLTSGVPCTAIFAATDNLAMGVMKVAMEANIRIPQDLSLISVDNCMFSSLPGTMLTTVDQRKMDLARSAMNLLEELVQRDSVMGDHTHRILHPRLIERSTCSEPNRM